MTHELSSDLAKELYTFMAFFDEELISDIPNDILMNITKLAAESNKDFYVDKNKSLMEQNMSEECKDFIGAIYFSCIANEIEKNELIETWYNNEVEV